MIMKYSKENSHSAEGGTMQSNGRHIVINKVCQMVIVSKFMGKKSAKCI